MESRTSYYGTRNHRSGQRPVVGYKIERNGQRLGGGLLEPEPPATFGWGHDLGGANHLAYALLKHVTGSAAIARKYHLQFAKDVVVHWGSDWTCTLDEILQWLNDSIPSVKDVIKDASTFVDGFTETKRIVRHACVYRGERRRNDDRKIVGYQISVAGRPWAGGPLMPRPPYQFDWGAEAALEHSVHLAFAILRHVTGEESIAEGHCFRFATKFVSTWGDSWSIDTELVLTWLASLGIEHARRLLERCQQEDAPVPMPRDRGILGDRLIGDTFRGVTRTYRGSRKGSELEVIVTNVDGNEVAVYPLTPEASLGIRKLSPSGFNWGYRGVASSQLALAILLDATNRISTSKLCYARFADEFVCTWADRWEIASPEILGWLTRIGAFLMREEEVAHG